MAEKKPKKPRISFKERMVLDFIGQFESNGGDYNIVYSGYKNQLEKPLTDMTVQEVFDLQKEMKDSGSSAVGAHQFINKTLKEEIKKQKIDTSEKFTPELQDSIIVNRLKRYRGLDDFLNGKIDEEQFAKNLSKEFASIPNPETGKSFYDGDGLNKSLTDVNTVLTELKNISATSQAEIPEEVQKEYELYESLNQQQNTIADAKESYQAALTNPNFTTEDRKKARAYYDRTVYDFYNQNRERINKKNKQVADRYNDLSNQLKEFDLGDEEYKIIENEIKKIDKSNLLPLGNKMVPANNLSEMSFDKFQKARLSKNKTFKKGDSLTPNVSDEFLFQYSQKEKNNLAENNKEYKFQDGLVNPAPIVTEQIAQTETQKPKTNANSSVEDKLEAGRKEAAERNKAQAVSAFNRFDKPVEPVTRDNIYEYNKKDYGPNLPLEAIGYGALAIQGLNQAGEEMPLREDELTQGMQQYARDLKRLSEVGLTAEQEAQMKDQLTSAYDASMSNIVRASGGNANLVLGSMTGANNARMRNITQMNVADAELKQRNFENYGKILEYMDQFHQQKNINNYQVRANEANQNRVGGSQLASGAFASAIDSIQYAKENGPGSANHRMRKALEIQLTGYDADKPAGAVGSYEWAMKQKEDSKKQYQTELADFNKKMKLRDSYMNLPNSKLATTTWADYIRENSKINNPEESTFMSLKEAQKKENNFMEPLTGGLV